MHAGRVLLWKSSSKLFILFIEIVRAKYSHLIVWLSSCHFPMLTRPGLLPWSQTRGKEGLCADDLRGEFVSPSGFAKSYSTFFRPRKLSREFRALRINARAFLSFSGGKKPCNRYLWGKGFHKHSSEVTVIRKPIQPARDLCQLAENCVMSSFPSCSSNKMLQQWTQESCKWIGQYQ